MNPELTNIIVNDRHAELRHQAEASRAAGRRVRGSRGPLREQLGRYFRHERADHLGRLHRA